MRHKETRLMTTRLFFSLLLISILMSACAGGQTKGPYSFEEATKAQLPLPLLYIDLKKESLYAQLNKTFYYFDLGDELRLEIYFTGLSPMASTTRVSRVTICTTCTPIGPTDEATGKQVSISWAAEAVGYTCKILPEATRA